MTTFPTRYFALLDGRPGAFGIAFPDAPGCTAMGKTEDEAIRNGIASLADWLGHSDRNGLERPRARGIVELGRDGDVRESIRSDGAVLVSIPVVMEVGRSSRVNISIDAGILDAIDEAAERTGQTRSGFLVSAALEKIKANA